MAEERVLQFLRQQNRPYNAQGVTDHLAQYGVKKAQAQRALDSLAEAGKIVCKECGKTKIYMIVQDDSDNLTKEEMDALQQRVAQLAEQLQTTGDDVRQKQKELKDLECTLTLEQMEARMAELQPQAAETSGRLAALRAGTRLISAGERARVELAFAAAMDAWAKRRRTFKAIWDQVSENIDQNARELWDEMGVETDEAADADHGAFAQLLPKRTRR